MSADLFDRLPPPTSGRVDVETRTLADEGVALDEAGLRELARAAWTVRHVRPFWLGMPLLLLTVVLAGVVGVWMAFDLDLGAWCFTAFLVPVSVAWATHALTTKVPVPNPSFHATPRVADGRRGVIAGDGDDPVGARLELTTGHGAGVALRVGWCRDFEVTLEDGRRVYVPAGFAAVDAPTDRWEPVPKASVQTYLDALGAAKAPRPPFPFETAYAVVLRPGDAIVVGEPLERLAPGDTVGGFRDAAAGAFRPRGVPRVALVD